MSEFPCVYNIGLEPFPCPSVCEDQDMWTAAFSHITARTSVRQWCCKEGSHAKNFWGWGVMITAPLPTEGMPSLINQTPRCLLWFSLRPKAILDPSLSPQHPMWSAPFLPCPGLPLSSSPSRFCHRGLLAIPGTCPMLLPLPLCSGCPICLNTLPQTSQ